MSRPEKFELKIRMSLPEKFELKIRMSQPEKFEFRSMARRIESLNNGGSMDQGV